MATLPHYLVVSGPNLNLLGTREPHIYGATTLPDIHARLMEHAQRLECRLSLFQSNHEGVLIDYLQQHGPVCNGIVLNPGGLTHYSIALRDCVAAIAAPTIETHLSNVHRREEWRSHSVISGVARGVVMGMGWVSYLMALEGVHRLWQEAQPPS